MSRWTDEEIRELVTLWPTNSASQIAKRLHRQRSAIRSKAERLRQEGLLPHNPPQHFDVNPPKRRPRAEIRHGWRWRSGVQSLAPRSPPQPVVALHRLF